VDKEIRVLLVEDSAVDAELIAREFVKRDLAHILKLVQSKDEFLKALQEFVPDIVLCDYKLPRFIAPEALEILKKSYPETPLIVVSGTIGEDIAVDTMKLGAVDYIMKDRLVRLVPAVRRALEEARIASERKHLETELSLAKEEEFRAIFDNAVDGILIADMESKKFYMGNNSICRMLGYSSEEIKNLGVMDIHPQKDIPYVINQFERQAKGDSQSADDLPVKRKNGSIFYADVNSANITIAGKTYLMGFFRDTTKRKKAEERIRESEGKFKTLYESSRDAIMILMAGNMFISGNSATLKLFGCKDEKEFISLTPADLSPQYQPDGTASAVKAQQMMAAAMKEGSHFFEWTHKRIDGTEFFATVLLTKMELKDQTVLQATVRDITERKKKDKLLLDTNLRLQETSQNLFNAKKELEKKNAALRQSHEVLEKQVEERTSELTDVNITLQNAETNLRTMINQNADGILIIDHKGIIRFVNNAAESLFGRKKEELIGETFGFAAVKDVTIEIEVIQKSGEVITAEMRAVEIKWEGEMVYLASLRDITERKKAEEKLKETMKMKSEFISMVSHELRTPLTPLKGGIAFVLDGLAGDINEEQKEVLGISKKNVDRLARLINNVLDSEKLESGKMKLDIQPNNINKTVRGVYEMFALTVKDTGINLLLELDDSLPEIGFDSDKITQVLTNLISNAMNFTKKGDIVIKTGKKDGTIHVSVSDTGCGIKQQDLPRVFGRFEQLATGGDRKTGGTGLGLSISREIIERHNGEIWLESKFGKGSKFTFTLPIYGIEDPIRRYVNDGIKEASKNNTRLSLVLISIADFDKLEQKLPHEKITSALKDMEAILENDLRRGKSKPNQVTDTIFRFSHEIFIVLTDCGKENIPGVKERLEQKLDDYLADQNLADKIRLLFGCAAYPDDAGTNEDLITKARKLQAIAPVHS
jgi:PAS domain S-box-containing protein